VGQEKGNVMRRKDTTTKAPGISRRKFVKIASIGLACVGAGVIPGKGVAGTTIDRAGLASKDPSVYRIENIRRVVLTEGETACTGNPERTSEKCTGCMSCMAACSLVHEGIVSSALSGIRVYHFTSEWALRETEKMFTHFICRQCPGVPPCDEVCPENAHYRDDKTGAVIVDHDKCIRCGACVEACPNDACWYSQEFDKIVKCDLCSGNPDGPQCVRNCSNLVLKIEEIR
jgi:Fe-S-cluster-containing hydrogenase component 2